MKNTKPTIKTVPNEKRKASKARRGRGIGAMEKIGVTHVQWAQSKDPLFKVKGMERHNKMKLMR